MEMADCEDIPDNLNDPLLERLFKAADTAKMREDTKESYMKSILGEAEYEANLEDWKAEGLEEGRAEGREEGLAEGLARGLAEGRAEGHAEGRAAGSKAKSYEIAAALKKAGIDTSIISSSTGLSEKEVFAIDC